MWKKEHWLLTVARQVTCIPERRLSVTFWIKAKSATKPKVELDFERKSTSVTCRKVR